MSNLNTAIRYDPAASVNPELHDLTRQFRRRDNAAFLAEVARRLHDAAETPDATGRRIDPGGVACIGLIGEYGLVGYGIRRAEELIRVDGTPSYWSHAFLLHSPLSTDARVNRDRKKSAWLWESTLEPPDAFSRFSDRNGVSARRIADYRRGGFHLLEAHCVPNFAVIAISLSPEERAAILARASDPNVDQLRYDVLGLAGTWFAYLTNRASRPNPLSDGHAIYCSAYVQLAYDAAGLDLAPGAHQRNPSPEHLWQGARYLYESFRAPREDAPVTAPRRVMGWYVARDRAAVVAPVDLADSLKLPRNLLDAMAKLGG